MHQSPRPDNNYSQLLDSIFLDFNYDEEFFKAFGAFWLYGLISFGGFVFSDKKLPETNGKSLKEIEYEIIH